MKMIKYIKTTMLMVLSAFVFTASTVCFDEASAQQAAVNQKPAVQQTAVNYINAEPIAVVSSPNVYLNKNILMKAKFDKFSTLGLDYKPAFKSSDDYISFLIKRDDTTYNIPLSEMKLFLKRDVAEKYIDLKTDDEVEIKGLVFSDALGDAWVDVNEFKIIKKAPEEKK